MRDECTIPLPTASTNIVSYERAPFEVGILLSSGFHTMIPAHAKLPYLRVEHLEDIIDFCKRTSISIRSRRSVIGEQTELSMLNMDMNRVVKATDTKFEITVELRKGLDGYCTVRDMYTNQETTVEFDASRTFTRDTDIIQLGSPTS